MIWIRVDGNHEIGMGHIMRCLSVAEAMQQLGQDVCFVVADECAAELLKQKQQRYFVLHTEYNQMESEIEILKQLIFSNKPDVLVVDSYSVTSQYFEQIKDLVKLVYIDDLGDVSYPVELLINYNVYASEEMYSRGKYHIGKILLGARYVPLRNEFRTKGKTVEREVNDVFVSTGGSDKYNMAGIMLDFFMQDETLKKLNYHVICGNFNVHEAELRQKAEKHPSIYIHKNVSNMADIMKSCDLAIAAAGSTLYELAALSIPSIVFSFADNQKQATKAFQTGGAAISVGHYEVEHKNEFMSLLVKNVKELREDYKQRLELAHNANALVDGQGAIRIAQAIGKM